MWPLKGRMGLGSTVVYNSIDQVLAALTKPEVLGLAEVKQVLSIATESGVIQVKEGSYAAIQGLQTQRSAESPFVVMEGLDGCGKTTLTTYAEKTLGMTLLTTPPPRLREGNLRGVMDAQCPSLRRAYYSLGNYLAAHQVLHSTNPVIMDRFWHSTTEYAVANAMRDGSKLSDFDLTWPSDLLKPNLVIFLSVSEKERIRRHQSRQAFTNTSEEQALAEEKEFRLNLTECYRSIRGVPFEELSVDSSLEESKSSIVSLLLKHFPSLVQHA